MKLTNRESELIEILRKRSPAPVSRQELRNRIWNDACGYTTVDELISRTRKKIEPLGIRSRYGVGYQIVEIAVEGGDKNG